MSNTVIWDSLKTPPQEALKTIKGGRLNGMTDISPQWRYRVMTEQFGPIGIGWYYTVDRQWVEDGADNERMAFVNVSLYIASSVGTTGWSAPICGTGGSMLCASQRSGVHNSDEAFKMATTDALSVSMKMLGVAADVYMGLVDSKYNKEPQQKQQSQGGW